MSGMKLVRSLAVAAAAFVVTGAFAAGSIDMNVTAQVKGTCKLITVADMPFILDQSLGGDQTKDATVTYRCTTGAAAPKFTVGGVGGGSYGTGTLTTAGNTFNIKFLVEWTDPSALGKGLGSGGDQTVNLKGTILEVDYLDAPAATYSKLVPVAINP